MLDADVIVLIGRRGMGKTLWGRLYCKNQRRLFLFDPTRKFENINWIEDEQELINIGLDYDGKPKKTRVGVYNPEFVEYLTRVGFMHGGERQQDSVLIHFEECATWLPSPQAGIPEWLREPVYMGRHKRCSLVFCAQRAKSIPAYIRSQATRVVSFNQTEKNDLDWLNEFYGDAAKQIPELDRFECLDFNNDKISRYTIKHQLRSKLGIIIT